MNLKWRVQWDSGLRPSSLRRARSKLLRASSLRRTPRLRYEESSGIASLRCAPPLSHASLISCLWCSIKSNKFLFISAPHPPEQVPARGFATPHPLRVFKFSTRISPKQKLPQGELLFWRAVTRIISTHIRRIYALEAVIGSGV